MKVFFYVRCDQQSKSGGDLVQALEYIKGLNNLGVEARLLRYNEDIAGCDVLHVFNLDRPWDCLKLVEQAVGRDIPVVLSPITHPRDPLWLYQRERSFVLERSLLRIGFGNTALERMKAMVRGVATKNIRLASDAVFRDMGSAQEYLIHNTSAVALLSESERCEIERQGLCLGKNVLRVIRNGVPTGSGVEYVNREYDVFKKTHQRFAVVGGRIEPRKNQIEIAKATEMLGIPTLFLGTKNGRHMQYCQRFDELVQRSKFNRYIGSVDHETFQAILAESSLHISASLFEVSPLVDLEARAVGKRIVCTQNSLGLEYLDSFASVCDPWSFESIKGAIYYQWNRQGAVAKMAVPTWAETCVNLYDLYRLVVSSSVVHRVHVK